MTDSTDRATDYRLKIFNYFCFSKNKTISKQTGKGAAVGGEEN